MSASVYPANWRKSRHSGGQADCVEIADNAEMGLIQDTKHRGPKLVLPRASFDAFLSAAVAQQ